MKPTWRLGDALIAKANSEELKSEWVLHTLSVISLGTLSPLLKDTMI